MHVTIGIDPGLDGAIAVLDEYGKDIMLADTPTIQIAVARGTKREYDMPGLVKLLTFLPPWNGVHAMHAVLEESQPMPRQGVRSMFTVGVGFGIWLSALAFAGIPYTRVRPAVWKRALNLRGKDKEASRLRAQQLFPHASLARKKDHGRAEALLLAWYCHMQNIQRGDSNGQQ